MGHRREPRQDVQCTIRILGTDANGRPFSHNAQTINVSRSGILLSGLPCPLKVGDTVAVTYKQEKARYRVVWVQSGTQNGKVGLQAVTPDSNLWDFPLPPPAKDNYAPQPGSDRRIHPRMPCTCSIEIRPQGQSAPIMGSVVELSKGGCFVEMPIPLPKGKQLKVTLWLKEVKVVCEAEVSNSRPGFGMGLRFTQLPDLERKKIEDFLNALPRSPFQRSK